MSVTRVQLVGNVSTGASFAGIVTATTFVGALTGNATGLSGTPNINVGNITGSAATFTNLTVNGTQTIINTTSLEISDKNIGIGSTSSPTDALADGAGITIYGSTNKTLTWSNTTKNWTFVGGGVTVSDLSVSGNLGIGTGNLGIGTTNPTAKLQVQGTVSCSSTISDAAGDVRSIPQNVRTSSYTLVATDRGKHIGITTGGVTIPTNIFAVGDAISIYNNSDYNQTITQGASTTLRLAGSTLTGNRTFGQYGLCTVLCVSSNTFVISGAGLS